MKGIFVILDGLGDLSNNILENKTPLEAAETPNLDFLASRGEMGFMYPVKPGYIPESDEAILSIFGNDLISSSSRGQLEAVGTGLKLMRGDLALRVNFGTIDSLDRGNIIDRRAGRTLTTAEAEVLVKGINNRVKLPMKFELKASIQHRAVLVLRGGFSDNISLNDSHYSQGRINLKDKISICKALDDEDNTQYTAEVLNDFIRQAYDILNVHPINMERRKKGLMPANFILIRGPGIENPKLKSYKKWISVAYMPLEIGFSKLSGMKVYTFDYPKMKDLDAYLNLYEGLRQACEFSIKIINKYHTKADYMYIHIKETDMPGHDNKPLEKKKMIEYVDKTLFNFLRQFAPPNKIKVVVTGDHSTPCRLKEHSADPVPVLFYNGNIPREKIHFSEKEARLGKLGRIEGKELLKKVGFVR